MNTCRLTGATRIHQILPNVLLLFFDLKERRIVYDKIMTDSCNIIDEKFQGVGHQTEAGDLREGVKENHKPKQDGSHR